MIKISNSKKLKSGIGQTTKKLQEDLKKNSSKAKDSSALKKSNKITESYTEPTKGRPEYQKNDAVLGAEVALDSWENNRPDSYESKYSAEIDKVLETILNREDFSYNMNADPLYQQYREQYVENGKKAMMDTVGNATALTGGYLNSYAQNVGQQAYDEYLNKLNGIAMDLRDRAFEQYSDEGDRLIEDITLLRSLDGDDYEKYLQELEQYYADGEYLLNKLANLSDADFEAFVAEVEAWESDRDYELKKYQDKLDRQEFEKELAFKKAEADREYAFKQSEAAREQANADREYALAVQKANASRSSGSSSSSKASSSSKKKTSAESTTKSYPKTYKEFHYRTGVAAILTENEFDRSETAKAKYTTYQKYLEEMYKLYGSGD